MKKVLIAAIAGLFALGACSTAKTAGEEEKGRISITSPANGSQLAGGTLQLVAATTLPDFKIVKADGDTSGKTGHWHVFVDREPVAAGETIAKETGIVHSAVNSIEISGLKPGTHTMTLVIGDGTHKRIGSHQAKVSFTTTA